MAYEHDVFVSYKWGNDLKIWVDKVFIPILKDALYDTTDSAEDSIIFHDAEENKPGGSIPLVLRDGVARSKCMVCVITYPYFTKSAWCPAELSAMLEREKVTAIRQPPKHVGLVFPVLFVDMSKTRLADRNPVYGLPGPKNFLTKIQPLELDEDKFFRISAGFKDTNGFDDLRLLVKKWVRESIKDR